MNITDYWRNKLADFHFRTATLAKPTVMAYALFTVAPSAAGGGTEVANAGAYARINLPPLDTNYYNTQGSTSGNSSGSGGRIANAVQISFAAPLTNWGVINGAAVFDSATYGAGNMLFWYVFPSIFSVNAGDGQVIFPANSFGFTFF